MTYLPEKFGFLAGSFFEAFASIDTSSAAPGLIAPTSFEAAFYSDNKGGEKILCNPPQNLPKCSPDKLLRKKIKVLTYLLSEHNYPKTKIKIH